METFIAEVRQTLVPRGEVKHGSLPLLLVAMTLFTGLVDALSYLVLGHVFVANMTDNVLFLLSVTIQQRYQWKQWMRQARTMPILFPSQPGEVLSQKSLHEGV